MRSFNILAAGLVLVAQFAFDAFAQSALPPAPSQKIAVNPLTNKVYLVDTDGDSVTALDIAAGTTKSIPVGDGPLYVAVNPATNRVYVNNARAASLSVIDGGNDTLIGTFPIGSTGPIAVNPVTNVIYIVRLTGPGSDEVTYFHGGNNTWYSIATESFQPIAIATNPVTNKVVIPHYATGDVRIIDGAFNPALDFPPTVSRGMWSKPVAVAVNPVTNKFYVITEDSRGPIAVLNGADNGVVFLATGVARIPKAVAVNPVTNKIYALFSNEVIVINGTTNALKSLPVSDAGTGAAALGINTATNRVLVASATGVLTVIDGTTDTVLSTGSVPVGTSGVAVNPVTGITYFDVGPTARVRDVGETVKPNPLTTTITPFSGNTTTGSGTFTFNATNGFTPNALPIRGVFYRVDSTSGSWIAATGSGPYTGTFTGLAPGSHTVHAFAVDGQDAPLATGAQSSPVTGTIASYTFTVPSTKVDPSVSLASSSNPANVNAPVTFTASVSGSAGTATGTVTFRDGTTPICTGIALSNGSAACSTSSLTAGTHSITAEYSGNASYNAATSSAVQQTIARLAQSITFGSAPFIVTGGTGNVSATASSGNAVTFTSTTPATCSVSGSVVTGLAAGTCTIAGNAAGNATYDPAPQATQSFPIVNPGTLADLTITQARIPNPASAGKDVVFTYTVTNSGAAATANVTLQNAVPAGAVFVWASAGCAVASGGVTCGLQQMASGAQKEVRVVWRPSAAGSLSNTVTVGGSTAESSSANNTSTTTTAVNATPPGVPVPRYRLYSDTTKEHHFTTDLNEYTVLGASGNWVQEGTVGQVLDNPGTFNGVRAIPYYRLYDTATKWHHWTTDANEYYTLGLYPNWNQEGVDGYILPTQASGTIELYRLTYPYLPGLHHWTTDAYEYDTLISQHGWVGEPGAGFVVP